MNPVLVWHWFAKMGAPILAAFMVGQYVAGRNCEEGKLREEIAALEAQGETVERLTASTDARRMESERAIVKALTGHQKAVNDEVSNDPVLRECRAVALPASLRLRWDPPDDPSTH